MSSARFHGVDHIGITVPDLDEAEAFLTAALGAEKVYDVLLEPFKGELLDALGVPSGAAIRQARMMRLGNGANLELFKYDDVEQRPPHRPNDFGLQHFAVQVDDIVAARQRFLDAGGTALSDPLDLPGGAAGEGNYFIYLRAPWGTSIELIAFGSPEAYEEGTDRRCWRSAPLPGR